MRHANPTFRTRVSCTDRAREKVVPHGSAARTVFVVSAQHGSPARGVCADFQSCTGRVELSTGRVHRLYGSWHGACSIVLLWFSTGRAILHRACSSSARGVQFHPYEVGNSDFSIVFKIWI